MYKVIYDFIDKNWHVTTQLTDNKNKDVIALPYPYNSPCSDNGFKAFFYWDSYFICRGLLVQNHIGLAENNLRNFIYEINKFGFIPNMNRLHSLNRSQVPLLGALIEAFIPYKKNDVNFLSEMVGALEKELLFWEKNRRFENGMFHYGTNATDQEKINFYKKIAVPRIKYDSNVNYAVKIQRAEATLAEAESGWDFTPRFERNCNQIAAVDLNSLIAKNYKIIAGLYELLGNNRLKEIYLEKFNFLKQLIQKVFWDEKRGGFFDYCPTENRLLSIYSCASFFPLWCNLATEEQAEKSLSLLEKTLEYDFGLVACEKKNEIKNSFLQWDYPNLWPPLQLIVMEGLNNYNFVNKAKVIAEKYLDVVSNNFDKHKQLYEKYNAVSGQIDVVDEYPMPPMLGWSAGTFVCCYHYFEKNKIQLLE